MILEEWEVIKYHYIIVFMLSAYLIGASVYTFQNRKKDLKKILIHIIISATIALGVVITIYSISYKTIHIIYIYEEESELELFTSKGWTIVEISSQYRRAHMEKTYEKRRD